MLSPSFNKYEDNYWGDERAPLEIVEYFDYQCEYCQEVMHVIRALKNKFGQSLKVIYRNFPNQNLHPLSLDAAVVAEAASANGKFQEMHELILENQKYLTRSGLNRLAEHMNIDMSYLEDQNKIRWLFKKVILDLQNGMKSGVWETPTFFINGNKYNGFDDFQNIYRACQYAIYYQGEIGGRWIS